MYIFLFSLFMVFVLVMAVWGYFDNKKLKGKTYTEDDRVKMYKKGLIIGFIPILVFIPICLFLNIKLYDIGFRLINLNYNIWFNIITFVISGGFLILLLYQMISFMVSAKFREQAKIKFAEEEKNDIVYSIVIPRTIKEKRLFFGTSLQAGICEEIIFRGLLFFILQALFPSLSIIFIIIIASVIFGFCHVYQGIGGFIKTTMMGALYCCLYVVTDSILLVAILHFVTDFSANFFIREESTLENKV